MVDLHRVAATHLETARAAAHGRSAELLVHDNRLRQSVIALIAGTRLAEHNAPHASSVHVLTGRVRLSRDGSGADTDLGAGELVVLDHERHSVEAVEDSVLLLTTVTGLSAEDRAL